MTKNFKIESFRGEGNAITMALSWRTTREGILGLIQSTIFSDCILKGYPIEKINFTYSVPPPVKDFEERFPSTINEDGEVVLGEYFLNDKERYIEERKFNKEVRDHELKTLEFKNELSQRYLTLLEIYWSKIYTGVIFEPAKSMLAHITTLGVHLRLKCVVELFDERYNLTTSSHKTQVFSLYHSRKLMNVNMSPDSYIQTKQKLKSLLEGLSKNTILDKDFICNILTNLPREYQKEIDEINTLIATKSFVDTRDSTNSSNPHEALITALNSSVSQVEEDGSESSLHLKSSLEIIRKLLITTTSSSPTTNSEPLTITYVTKILMNAFEKRISNNTNFKSASLIKVQHFVLNEDREEKGRKVDLNSNRFNKNGGKEKKGKQKGKTELKTKEVEDPCDDPRCEHLKFKHESAACYRKVGFPNTKPSSSTPVCTSAVNVYHNNGRKVSQEYFLDDPGSNADVVYDEGMLLGNIPLNGMSSGVADAKITGVGCCIGYIPTSDGRELELRLQTVFLIPTSSSNILGNARRASRILSKTMIPCREGKVPSLSFKCGKEYLNSTLVSYKDHEFDYLKFRVHSGPLNDSQKEFIKASILVNQKEAIKQENELYHLTKDQFSSTNSATNVVSPSTNFSFSNPIISPSNNSTLPTTNKPIKSSMKHISTNMTLKNKLVSDTVCEEKGKYDVDTISQQDFDKVLLTYNLVQDLVK